MKILSMRAENIKRISAVEITPDGAVVEITGRNGQGKTSILDAIRWALDSNKAVQSMPVREGADAGYVQLDLGEYIITKKFRVKDGKEIVISLTVANRDGAKYGSPTELLKGFYGAFTFDPLAFAEAKPEDQVTALRQLVAGFDFDANDAANKADYDKRTEVNRRIKSLQEQRAAITVPADTPAEPVSLSALMDEYNAAMAHNSRLDALARERNACLLRLEQLKDRIAERETQIAALKRQIAELEQVNLEDGTRYEELREGLPEAPPAERIDLIEIQERISSSETINRNVEKARTLKAIEDDLAAEEKRSAELTAAIDGRKTMAAQAVREAKLPIDGIEITEDRILLNGIPLDQASDAEQLRLSIAVAGALSPKLRIARVRDGSKLDRAAMQELTRYCTEHDLQVWIETVESSRPTAIVIEDGTVAAPHQEAAE
jgi:hypothetical protein